MIDYASQFRTRQQDASDAPFDDAPDHTPPAPADSAAEAAPAQASPTESAPALSDDANPSQDIAFDPATPRPQRNGWTAERQRGFIQILAEGGCVLVAALSVGMNARSAYRLRLRPDGADFARAWDKAVRLATTRLVALAFDRAINGVRSETWKDGKLVSVKIAPAERTHLFLLRHLDPMRFGNLSGLHDFPVPNPVTAAVEELDALLPTLQDMPEDAGVGEEDYGDAIPGESIAGDDNPAFAVQSEWAAHSGAGPA